MYLAELIKFLAEQDPTLILPAGFGEAYSYRGDYSDLCFEPAQTVTVEAMLKEARSAVGKTFMGYKGGDYVMREFTQCFLSRQDEASGEPITVSTLAAMIAQGTKPGRVKLTGATVHSYLQQVDAVLAAIETLPLNLSSEFRASISLARDNLLDVERSNGYA